MPDSVKRVPEGKALFMPFRCRFSAIFAACLSLAPAGSLAQERREEPRKLTPDVPGPVHQRLDDLAGAWDVAIQYKLGKNVQNGKATCDARLILGGRFLQQDYHSRFQGEPYHVMQILGYDNQKKKVIELKMDTMSTGVLHNEGEISEDGKVITNLGESLDPRTKKPYKLRTVYTIADRDHFTLEWYRIDDAGTGEKVVTLTHVRKKASD
jgi:hypothetical protein